MRVALIQPSSPFLIDQGVHGPLGLWYLGAALKRAGHEVVYCDRGLGDALPDDCDVWCVTGTTPQRDDMARVIRAAGSTPVIACGPPTITGVFPAARITCAMSSRCGVVPVTHHTSQSSGSASPRPRSQ